MEEYNKNKKELNKKNNTNKENKIYIKNLNEKKESLSRYNKTRSGKIKNEINTKNKKSKMNNKFLLIILISLLFGIFLIFFVRNLIIKRRYNKRLEKLNYSKEEIKEHNEKAQEIMHMNPDKRARKYLNEFINNIKKERYDDEYFRLYYEFKNIFFPTLIDFENYIKENFPKDPAVKINNFEQAGALFILFVDIVDKDNPEKSLKNMKFIYKEENLMEYVFSFSVKNKNEKEEKYITPPDSMDFSDETEYIEKNKEYYDLTDEIKKQEIEKQIKEEHEKNLIEANKEKERQKQREKETEQEQNKDKDKTNKNKK